MIKYKIIKSKKQYLEYCNLLESLLLEGEEEKNDEIELLTLIIEDWEEKRLNFTEKDPIEILKWLMHENDLKPVDIQLILGLSKGSISKILNYQKGLSKISIRKLSEYFKLKQEIFNRPYQLNSGLFQRQNKKTKSKKDLVIE